MLARPARIRTSSLRCARKRANALRCSKTFPTFLSLARDALLFGLCLPLFKLLSCLYNTAHLNDGKNPVVFTSIAYFSVML